jgi:hypothetical protein
MIKQPIVPVTFALALGFVALIAGCSTGGAPEAQRPTPTTEAGRTGTVMPPRPGGGGFGRSPITLFDDCNELLAHLQTEARSRVTAWGLGGGGYHGSRTSAQDGDTATDSAGGAPIANSAPEYSRTNTQEAEVDEGDVVETDGRYVYNFEIFHECLLPKSDQAPPGHNWT